MAALTILKPFSASVSMEVRTMNQQSAISNQQDAMKRQKGFTLIELSIVLVIIGLIVGGVLVGQDLILAAKKRGAISATTELELAVNVFRMQYDSLPGDMLPSKAARFGFFELATSTEQGNGKINGRGTTSVGENYTFWRHLSEAGLIDGKFGQDSSNPINPSTGYPTSNTTRSELFLPALGSFRSVHQNYYWTTAGVDPDGSRIYMTGVTRLYTDGSVSVDQTKGLTVEVAHAIDTKLDDGHPGKGKVVFGFGSLHATSQQDGNCLYGTPNAYGANSGLQYNLESPTSQACGLLFYPRW
ncbi:protein containing Prepilin-type cleavage/methylation [Rhodopirellula europaea 6C]|uniref:Protein containing Prepilin-type cleavage/methylation n=2 Tax=Rhodopirellula TaxID=265488 RepID=M2AXY6_9BACT|nr:protein containing Prepilin-type cleavage/methylation [Rhodopirellula europaea 6C]